MNYQKIYNLLIDSAKHRDWKKGDKVLETHHIVPKSCGGSDDKSNLVNLTLREHFIAHLLLVKIYKDSIYYHKMIRAVFMMTRGSVNSRAYNQIKEIHINNLRNRVFSDEQKLAISKANLGNKGRSGYTNNENQLSAWVNFHIRRSNGEYTERELIAKKVIAEKNRQRCKGVKPHNTAKIEYNGIVYNGWQEFTIATGISRYLYLNNKNNLSKREVCKHCGKEVSTNTINRWHNENCKEKLRWTN